MAEQFQYRHGRYAIDNYQFQIGGLGDVYIIDFVKDPAQGFGVPAKSLAIKNQGGGRGYNYIYFRTTQNGSTWDEPTHIDAGNAENYEVADGCVFMGCMVWASNALVRFSLRATPGRWNLGELRQYISSPVRAPVPVLTSDSLLGDE